MLAAVLLASTPWRHIHLRSGCLPPLMFTESSGRGEHDVYGFEDVELPPLPGGHRLVLRQMLSTCPHGDDGASDDDGDASADDEGAQMWRKIERYVGNFEDDADEHVAVGGEIWPAAAALCSWLSNHSGIVHGTRVLELGAGTGAVGLYAAGLGASRVLLTDGGSDELLSLCAANVGLNADLFAPNARVGTARLDWGVGGEEAALTGEHFDWVLASDCTYDAHGAVGPSH